MAESTPSMAITGLVLSGGRGSRMGGVDKGLDLLDGRPLVSWALERLAPQVTEVLINANRSLARYASLGYRVIPDIDGEYSGPLAGLQRGLMEASCALVATVPCDTPCFPMDLVARLAEPLKDGHVDLAVARTRSGIQPVFCVARKTLLPQLTAFMEDGGRKVEAWFATLHAAAVDFQDEGAFANVNTPDDLRALEAGPRR